MNNTKNFIPNPNHPLYQYCENIYNHPIHGKGYVRFFWSETELWVEWEHKAINIAGCYTNPYFIETPDYLKKYLVDSNTNNTHCECGKEKHGFASHSNWCQKYE